jgi:hypothetical protein
MRPLCTALALALLAARAGAVELIEFKSGKLLTVEGAARIGDKIHVRLTTPSDRYAAISLPMDQILPEYVYYIWERGIAEGDRADRLALAEWARRNGLFRHALRAYATVAESDPATRAELPALEQALHEEEATWLFERAESLFRRDEVKDARVLVRKVLDGFQGSKESGRALELLKMIDERDKFLSLEQRRKEEERRIRRQRIEVKTQVARIAQGDAYFASANLRHVGEARWRLKWAGQLYDGAVASLQEFLPFVEDEALQKEIEIHIGDAMARIQSTYLRLGDLRYLCGDLGAALDAAYRVLDVDPANAAASSLRDRILDGPGPTHIRRDGGFLSYGRRFSEPYWDTGFGYRRRFR